MHGPDSDCSYTVELARNACIIVTVYLAIYKLLIFIILSHPLIQCDGPTSLESFFDGINSEPVKIGVIGCGCSVATEPVAAIVHHWNIPLVCIMLY